MIGAPTEIRLGHPPNGVLIRVVERMHPDARDYWDGNWLVSPIEVRAGGFTASVLAGLRVEELMSFREQVQRLLLGDADTARLASMEEWLSLTVRRRGEALDVRGVITDSPGLGSQLEFSIEGLMLSDLSPLIEELRSAEAAFPLLGLGDA
jgi:hypothetical protein